MAKNDSRQINIPGLGQFHLIKFGPGVIGRTTTVISLLIFAFVPAMYFLRDEKWMVFSLILILTCLVIGFVGWSFRFAEKNPALAVTEGAEVVRYMELELAAKDPKVIDVTPGGSANTAAPKSLSFGSKHQ
ncbi:TPA: hypothetical protein IHM15_004566 [Escherichia coli]|nr:hypothetical protein [Escherichia coli]